MNHILERPTQLHFRARSHDRLEHSVPSGALLGAVQRGALQMKRTCTVRVVSVGVDVFVRACECVCIC
jgi:hypothetical protein